MVGRSFYFFLFSSILYEWINAWCARFFFPDSSSSFSFLSYSVEIYLRHNFSRKAVADEWPRIYILLVNKFSPHSWWIRTASRNMSANKIYYLMQCGSRQQLNGVGSIKRESERDSIDLEIVKSSTEFSGVKSKTEESISRGPHSARNVTRLNKN